MKFDNSYFHSKNDAPETESLKIKDIGYCCSDCPSLIEILSINENNNISFYLLINHNYII